MRHEGTPQADRRRGPRGQPGGPVALPRPRLGATKTYRFNVSGTEVSATSTTGRFVGTASGSALGAWYAEVIHDPLSGPANTQVNIRSGGSSLGWTLLQAEPGLCGEWPVLWRHHHRQGPGGALHRSGLHREGSLRNVS